MRWIPLLVLAACTTAEGDSTADSKLAGGPLVLELFTSQGCSSCPPADKLLATLAKEPDLAPLSFHVDYWNDLGWADPYSQQAWTDRQHQYARALGDTRVYTPELVVGGAVGMVGSSTGQIKLAIAKASRPALLAATGTWKADSLEVKADVPANTEVLVAVWEAERTVKVPRGENSGATLANARIVRKLVKIPAGKSVKIALEPSWKSVGAVAFAQRADKKIIASAMLPRS
jgi:hypothetical protein